MRAWGKKRDDFYGTDVRSKVDIGVSSEDEEAGGCDFVYAYALLCLYLPTYSFLCTYNQRHD